MGSRLVDLKKTSVADSSAAFELGAAFALVDSKRAKLPRRDLLRLLAAVPVSTLSLKFLSDCDCRPCEQRPRRFFESPRRRLVASPVCTRAK